MVLPLVFLVLLSSAIAVAWQAGTAADRRLILAMIVAALATFAAEMFAAPNLIAATVLSIDLVLLWFVLACALKGDQHWPVWFTALLLVAMLIDAVSLILPDELAKPAAIIGSGWLIPALCVMVIGILLDARRGVGREA